MAERYEELRDAPSLQFSEPSSRAKGDEAMSEIFGNVASAAGKTAISMAEEKSKMMMMSSYGELNDLKTSALMQISEHPDQAKTIVQNTYVGGRNITQNAYVNDADRSKLDYTFNTELNQVALKGFETQKRYNDKQAEITFLNEWPKNIETYKSLLLSDINKADDFKDMMVTNIRSLAGNQTLTPSQAANAMMHIAHIAENRQAVTDLMGGDSEKPARDYHYHSKDVISGDPEQVVMFRYPHNEETSALAEQHYSDTTHVGLQDAITSNKPLSPVQGSALLSMTPEQLQKFSMISQGTREALANITSGESYSSIVHDFNNLGSNYIDQAKMKQYKKFFSDLENTDTGYAEWINKTPLGAQATQELSINLSAVNNLKGYSDEEKFDMAKSYSNDYITKLASIGMGRGIPLDLIKPIPSNLMTPIENGFQLDQDPMQTINGISFLNNTNRGWASNNFSGTQKAVFNAVSAGVDNDVDMSVMKDLIAANQGTVGTNGKLQGRSFSELTGKKAEDESGKSVYINALIASDPNMMAIRKYTNLQEGGMTGMEHLTDAMSNYVKYSAQKYNDVKMSNASNYVSTLSKQLQTAYGVVQGSNYIFNDNVLGFSDLNYSILSNYTLNEVHRQAEAAGYSPSLMMSTVDMNPFVVTNDNKGNINVVDSTGNKVYSEPYTPRMMNLAQRWFYSEEQQMARREHLLRPKFSTSELTEEIKSTESDSENKGVIQKGNIDLNNRPEVKNSDGTVSTVRTITVEMDGKTILLPTVINGKIVSNEEAVSHYKQTGEHLGIFKDEKSADAYDKKMHEMKGWRGNKWRDN